MKINRILGIDPGITGGVALLSSDGLLAERMPVVTLNGKNIIHLAALGGFLDTWEPDIVWIEEQQSMPKQGVSSTFRTGLNYGTLIGFITGKGLPIRTVNPRKWKAAMGVPSDKAAAIAIATRLYPNSTHLWKRKSDDGVAEAALIAMYGSEQ